MRRSIEADNERAKRALFNLECEMPDQKFQEILEFFEMIINDESETYEEFKGGVYEEYGWWMDDIKYFNEDFGCNKKNNIKAADYLKNKNQVIYPFGNSIKISDASLYLVPDDYLTHHGIFEKYIIRLNMEKTLKIMLFELYYAILEDMAQMALII